MELGSAYLNILAVFMVSFAGTTIDTATRIQRYVISEVGTSLNVGFLQNKYLATLVAVGSAYLLAFRKGANVIWPLFGATNQLLAGLALLIVTAYLARKGKPIIYTLVPMVFMIVMTTMGMLGNFQTYLAKGDTLLTAIDGVVILLEIWLVAEAWGVIQKHAFGHGAGVPR